MSRKHPFRGYKLRTTDDLPYSARDYPAYSHCDSLAYPPRIRYRMYLAEQKAYGFFPLDFRTWYEWQVHYKNIKP
jgi:hypothetical protein